MAISTVQNEPLDTCFKVTLDDGTIQWVPKNEENSDYKKILLWLEAGGTITAS